MTPRPKRRSSANGRVRTTKEKDMPTAKPTPKKRVIKGKSTDTGRKVKAKTRTTLKAAVKRPRTKARSASATKSDLSSKARSSSIVETSPLTWSSNKAGPTFDQIQLAAYHGWLQNGGTEFDNWVAAEADLKRKSSGDSNGA